MKLLPRHLTTPLDKTSHFYDGRYAQRHPNSIYSDEQSSAMVLAMLQRAQAALSRWRQPSPLPIEAANDVRIAFESLSDINWHFPPIMMWCCWTTYAIQKDGKRWSDNHVVWSAHFTEEEANQWLPLWRKKFSDRDDYEWHVGLHDCKITDVRDPEIPVPGSL